ncbi:5-(carboxyamino)imidazole ribonucleotide synthase [Vagococcus entomophilus]|uniref:5-(carboxyamino)imidazole ribonucleotide synthase n=1 Tax=Vagococcus entomophilus TaxID=1160095 RepID=UPI001B867660|nr:5-(carboxyamino)imidazole ribonucleotide synthase [Vagococcus entomophilus]
MSEMILPGQTIGIIGGGQLGKMLCLSAKKMGFEVGVLDPLESCPAAQVADWQIVGGYSDEFALEKMAQRCDVLTYEFENVDAEVLKLAEKAVPIPQGSKLLEITQDRLLEKAFLDVNNINIAPYATIVKLSDIEESIDSIGFPCVLKTTRGGYDGKGQHVMNSMSDIQGCIPLTKSGTCVLEAWIPFEKELSILIAANSRAETMVFPVVENTHRNNILHQTIAPAKIPDEVIEEVERIGKAIAESIELRGVMAVELFLAKNGSIYVNELAPRPHNSGHYSIEACEVSQFDAHIRGICNWPLPQTPNLLSPAMMVNILGQHFAEAITEIEAKPEWNFHFYGKKQAKYNRKMGHITILTKNIDETKQEIKETNIWD